MIVRSNYTELENIVDCLDNQRIPVSDEERQKRQGDVPYYGANGQVGFINDSLFDEELLLLAEDGGSWGPKEKCAYIISGKSWVNNHAHVLRCKQNTNIRFLMYFLNYSDLRSYVSGTTRGKLNQQRMNQIKVFWPEINKQKRIAENLTRAESALEKRRQTLRLADQFLKSAFLGMFGDPSRNPMKWPVKQIGDVVLVSQYGTSEKSNTESNGYIVLGMGNITYDGQLDLSKVNYVDMTEKEFNQLRLVSGDVIFNRTNSTDLVGKTACWRREEKAVLASYLVKLKLVPSVVPEFFSFLLNSSFYKNIFAQRCKKAVGQSNISPTLLKEFDVFVPPQPIQQKFADLVQKVEKLKEKQRQSEAQLQTLFNSLMQKAFRGELFKE